ncbi:unnamed protein product [Paramecium pentaurelia]|uniref:Uncharacterized protein n=1 Tax=Paramecium pentaurelia TaxID=43138 RepID=A0A8S1TP77_9CILI|nr:unnamed protein product [Paramecium pentaurelia]
MEQKIEELNQRYSKLINEEDNQNIKFTKNFQNFYLYAISAGDEDFSKGIQATKKLKKLIDTLFESSKLANQIIVNEAFSSIQMLIANLLQSTRWQDNNAGIWIIIFYLESNYNFLDIKNLSQIFKLHLTQYLEVSEEMFQENTSKLLTLLMNKNDIFLKSEYLIIQEKLIQNQDNNQLIGMHNQKINFQEKYISKIQLSPLLQILKELQNKTNINNFTDLLLKCCLINQKQTQLSAFNQLLNVEDTDQNDFIEVLRYSLLHNNIEITKLGTQLAKQVIKNYECNSLQDIKLLIFLNQYLVPVRDNSSDLIFDKFKVQKNDVSILTVNFKLILNICSILALNEDYEYRDQAWRILFSAIKPYSYKEISQYINQLISLCQTAKNETQESSIYYFLYFFYQFIKKIQDSDKNQNLLFAKIICNFVGQFRNQTITTKIYDILNCFDFNDAQLQQLQIQSNVQDSSEIQQAWKELRQKLLLPKPKV